MQGKRLLVIAVDEPLPELDGKNRLLVQRLCEMPSAEEIGRAAMLASDVNQDDFYIVRGNSVLALIEQKIMENRK